ncbi:MAG TPA: type II secretion system minor pseudopilin GspI [Geopsychrobacteraceae bacterium]|nr:type II secretion system minor pseudopilin GspI [Geopsychrobacteraceae bacterium]
MTGARRYNDQGFTLLEVMIALAIVSIALVSLLSLSNRSISVQERLQRETQATLLAQHLLSRETVLGTGKSSGWQEQEESFDEPFSQYRWQVSYQDTIIPQVKQVTVSVIWGEVDRNEQVNLVSFLEN